MPPVPGSHMPAELQSGGSGCGQHIGSVDAHPHVTGSALHGSLHVFGSVGSMHGGGGGGGHIGSFAPQVGGGHAPLASHLQYGSVGSMHGGGGGMQFGSMGSVHIVPHEGSPG